MKVCIVQPAYPRGYDESLKTVDCIIDWLGKIKNDTRLIVLPEYSNCPGISTREEMSEAVSQKTESLLGAARKAARRCKALVCVNFVAAEGGAYSNTSLLFDKQGEIISSYRKAHLTEFEKNVLGLAAPGKNEFQNADPVFFDGAGYAMITCYDIYFPEYIQAVAAKGPNILLHPSYQRGEKSGVIESLNRARSFDADCFIIRASYSMGAGSETGGHSMVTAPDGGVLGDFGQKTGLFYLDLPQVYRKTRPSCYGGGLTEFNQLLESSRKPWLYRQAGQSCALPDSAMPYPRICAHRGFSAMLPQNSSISFAAAVSMGAHEIELDIRPSKDGELIVCHDDTINNVSSGLTGAIAELTYSEIMQAEIGSKVSPMLAGLKFSTFEQVLELFANKVIINLHIKSLNPRQDYNRDVFKRIINAIDRYDCRKHIYIAGGQDVLRTALDVAPDVTRCCLEGQHDFSIIDHAVKYHCRKVQFFKPCLNRDMISRAHGYGMKCNVYWSDDLAEARSFFEMGIDTVLTNNCALLIFNGINSTR